ncbi:MAG: type II toxin-antitoxin system RelE/ParE family toxin [Ruminococcus sp.]|nr:type II toxin-antitoxin system RelE/ParE family toxin [Ruminococcus sp.]
MDDIKFQLRYLPLFYEDMAEVVDYISNDLQNPTAALKLIDLTEQAIIKRLDNPLSFQPTQSKRERKHPYYRININNYAVFYVVIDDVMEVRRFLYSRRDIQSII